MAILHVPSIYEKKETNWNTDGKEKSTHECLEEYYNANFKSCIDFTQLFNRFDY